MFLKTEEKGHATNAQEIIKNGNFKTSGMAPVTNITKVQGKQTVRMAPENDNSRTGASQTCQCVEVRVWATACTS